MKNIYFSVGIDSHKSSNVYTHRMTSAQPEVKRNIIILQRHYSISFCIVE